MHWFGVPGLANGLAVMRDEETRSLWDHITGECFEGPLKGKRLDFWPVQLTNVATQLEKYPDTILYKSDHRSLKSMVMKFAANRRLRYSRKGTVLPPHFRRSMHGDIDPRLPEGEQGLGVMDKMNRGKFYPVRMIPNGGQIEDEWQGRKIIIERCADDGVPKARFADGGSEPMQLLSRWYGFAFTYPDCEIYSPQPYEA